MTRSEYRRQNFLLALLIVLIILGVGALVTGCGKKPISSTQTNNSEVKLDLLFEHNGCKIYRFYDSGHSRYWSDCRGRVNGGYNQNCGKGCTRFEPDDIETTE